MKVLITGATGFVGRNLLSKVVDRGWDVSVIARNPTKLPKGIQNRVRVYEGDILRKEFLISLGKREQSFDVVIHMAASLDYYGDEQKVFSQNVEGTRNVLELAERTEVKRFVYASSIEAMGPVSLSEVPASVDLQCRPVSVYGRSKLLAEKLVSERTRGRMSSVILRIGNVYGPEHFSFVLEFAQAVKYRMRLYEFLPVYAHRLIHPVHNDDVSDGVIAACSSRVEFSLVHLCGQYASVGELFEKCAQSIGEELSRRKSTLVDKLFIRAWSRFMKSRRLTDTITYLTSGRGRRIHRAYSVKELKRDLGFEAQVALTEGIHSTVQWGLRNGMLN